MKKKAIIIGTAVFGLITLAKIGFSQREVPLPVETPQKIILSSTDYIQKEQKRIYERVFGKKEQEKIPSYQVENFNQDTEKILLARLIMGETEGCSKLEKIAAAYTAINRAEKSKEDLKEIILKPYQYSCFNEEVSRREVLKNPIKYNKKEFLEDIKLAEEILSKMYEDPTEGATHYYNPELIKTPHWAKNIKPIKKIGHHLFFK